MKSGDRLILIFLLLLMISTTGCAANSQQQPQLSDIWIRPTDSMEMVFVPGGTLQMGSTEDQVQIALSLCQEYPDAYGKCASEGFQDETPQHSHTVDDFWIDRTEVTNAQYKVCVEEGICNPSRLDTNQAYNDGSYPVAGIPWEDAVVYCQWAGGRLPTEIEWEYAARGSEGSIFPWGDNFECGRGSFGEDCTPCDDGFKAPSPVGTFPEGVSWCGAMDMAGNVWEWTLTDFVEYPVGDDPFTGEDSSGGKKVLRGGSWGYCPAFVRSAFRYPVPPTADYLGVGFRCVLQKTEGSDN
jgi:serine/threonine-protein kinase